MNHQLDASDQQLIRIARSALAELQGSTDPCTVGCALRSKNGSVYRAVSCYGIYGSCAERSAMDIAMSAGEREFETIVVVHENALNYVVSPCGRCRQMLYEHCPDIGVIVNDDNGALLKVTARDLLPYVTDFTDAPQRSVD